MENLLEALQTTGFSGLRIGRRAGAAFAWMAASSPGPSTRIRALVQTSISGIL